MIKVSLKIRKTKAYKEIVLNNFVKKLCFRKKFCLK